MFSLLLLGALLLTLIVLITLLVDQLSRALPVFQERGLDFLTSPLSPDPSKAGVQQGLVGSILIGVLVSILCFPLGILTAVYLEEYAPANRFTRFININIRNLAGVPSIVYGLLGLTVFVAFLDAIGFPNNGRNIIAGAATLTALILPIVIITSAEALRAVPVSLREGGYGIGSSRWQVTRQLVLPAARPGHPHRDDPRPRPRPGRDGAAAARGRRPGHLLDRRHARRPVDRTLYGAPDDGLRLGAGAPRRSSAPSPRRRSSCCSR